MNWLPLLAAPLILAGCAPQTEAPTATPTTSWTYTPPAPTVDTTAVQARQQIEDLQPSWLPYVSDVTFNAGVLRVAVQVDANTDQQLAGDIAKAVATNIRLGNPDLRNKVDWVEVTDGAGTHISQESV